jgi:hypothetical protein
MWVAGAVRDDEGALKRWLRPTRNGTASRTLDRSKNVNGAIHICVSGHGNLIGAGCGSQFWEGEGELQMNNQPNPQVLARLYGLPSPMDAALAALYARKTHLDSLIAALEAEQAMRKTTRVHESES